MAREKAKKREKGEERGVRRMKVKGGRAKRSVSGRHSKREIYDPNCTNEIYVRRL